MTGEVSSITIWEAGHEKRVSIQIIRKLPENISRLHIF